MWWSWRAVRGLVLAFHPGPTVVVTGLAAALAAGVGAEPATTLLVAAAVLAGQLSVGWSNDWLDAARDLAVARAGKPVVAGLLSARELRTAAAVAVAACVPMSLATGWLPGVVHLLAVASAWAYNLVLKRTVLSWLPYAVSFGLLVQFVTLAQPGRPVAAWWATAGASLLGFGAHAANVLPDLEDDAATGVSGLPHRLGRARTTLMALGALVAAVVLVVLAPAGPPSPAAWVGGGAALALAGVGAVASRADPRSRLPFTAAMAVAVVCVVVLVLAGPAIAR
ncbi:ubiquinone biosynthesis protein UbiA [Cellulomonas sp. WB94]|uniref:UbiA family prenyltransferase n=1 Tax=Cellulomonas sp. WB94 TaxID=2173174 RepID=UPI000D571B9C|nr:UbiA family prenyltransferase [Cellulomonas sp. WB94]PVU81192.1 ubiquinone biosynthesis protein UbiA [Cellulomonas sp. WB94]